MVKVIYDHQIFIQQQFGGISRCFVELYRHMPESCKATIAVHECENDYARELDGVKPEVAYEAFALAAAKLPVKTKIVERKVN